jgi:hypothetical protein
MNQLVPFTRPARTRFPALVATRIELLAAHPPRRLYVLGGQRCDFRAIPQGDRNASEHGPSMRVGTFGSATQEQQKAATIGF